jgi:hypothetical protein
VVERRRAEEERATHRDRENEWCTRNWSIKLRA